MANEVLQDNPQAARQAPQNQTGLKRVDASPPDTETARRENAPQPNTLLADPDPKPGDRPSAAPAAQPTTQPAKEPADALSDGLKDIKDQYTSGRETNRKTTRFLSRERAQAEDATSREALEAAKGQDVERDTVLNGLEGELKKIEVPSREAFAKQQEAARTQLAAEQDSTLKMVAAESDARIEAINQDKSLSPEQKHIRIAEEEIRCKALSEQLGKDFASRSQALADTQSQEAKTFEEARTQVLARREEILGKMERVFWEGQLAKEEYGKVVYGSGLDAGTAKVSSDSTTALGSEARKRADRALRQEKDAFWAEQDSRKDEFKARMEDLRNS
jgi:hypothetical protein